MVEPLTVNEEEKKLTLAGLLEDQKATEKKIGDALNVFALKYSEFIKLGDEPVVVKWNNSDIGTIKVVYTVLLGKGD